MRINNVFCMALIYIAFIALAAFLCWHFNTGWGVAVLLLAPSYKEHEERKTNNEN